MRALVFSLFFWVFSLIAWPRSARAETSDFTIGPVASWVVRVEPDLVAKPKEGEAHDGSYVLLDDLQRNVAVSIDTYVHRVRKVLTPAAVESFAQVSVEFHPQYERLVLHAVRVRRGAVAIDALRRESVKVLQQESDLAAQLYRGTLTALMILDDVRVGDVIELEYSLLGSNPVLGTRFAGGFDLAYRQPVHLVRRRLLSPSARPIRAKVMGSAVEPKIQLDGPVREWSIELREVPALIPEDELPDGYDPVAWVQFSEYPTWREVVDWAKPMYEAPHVPSEGLRRRIEEIRASSTDPKTRVLAALAFVQGEIRYLGIELGASSHRPETPSKVFERRFGDCKDKAQLLVAMLRELGIDAKSAFVNTSMRGEIAQWLPSPLAFDHVIVRAIVDGRTYWLDGTISDEKGDLSQRDAPAFARALVVSEVEGLTPIERTPLRVALISVHEDFVVKDRTSPVTLAVKTVYRGRRADAFRARVASEPWSEIARGFINYYARFDADVSETATPAFADDAEANTITVTENYRFPSFWKGEKRTFYPYALEEAVHRPKVVRRKMPLAIPYPTRLEHTTRVTFPGNYLVQRDAQTLTDDTLRLEYEASGNANVVTIRHVLETFRDAVPVSGVPEYFKMLDRMDESLSYTIDQRALVVSAPTTGFPTKAMGALGAAAAVFCGVVLGRAAWFRRRRTLVMRRAEGRAGEVPAKAFDVHSDADVEALLAKARCNCGARWNEQMSELLVSEAMFGGRRLFAVRRQCSACGDWMRRWFDRRGVE